MTRSEIEAELDSLGMPPFRLGSFRVVNETLIAIKAWRKENPEKSARQNELCELLEVIHRRTEEAQRAEAIANKAMTLLERSGVGQRSAEHAAGMDATGPKRHWPALEAAKDWLGGPKKTWLVLAGSKGAGKTVAAAWCVQQMCRQGESAYFRRMTELARMSTFDAGADEIERLKRCALLVLDDFGTENLTDHARGILFEVLDARHEGFLRTVLTSNLGKTATNEGGKTRPSLRDSLGERISERIRSDGKVVFLEGASARGGP